MTTYSRPKPNLYVSSDGFSVEVLGQTGLWYSTNGKRAFVDSEVLVAPAGILVYRESILRWESQSGSEVVSEEEREQIVQNIAKALGFHGVSVQLI